MRRITTTPREWRLSARSARAPCPAGSPMPCAAGRFCPTRTTATFIRSTLCFTWALVRVSRSRTKCRTWCLRPSTAILRAYRRDLATRRCCIRCWRAWACCCCFGDGPRTQRRCWARSRICCRRFWWCECGTSSLCSWRRGCRFCWRPLMRLLRRRSARPGCAARSLPDCCC